MDSLQSGDFSGLTGLRDLFLQHNVLTSLPEDVFSDLSSLLWLRLDQNALTALPEDVFSGLSSLGALWLHHNMLMSLPVGLFRDLQSLSTPIRKYNNDWNESASLTSSRRIREIITRSQCGSRWSAVSRGERSAAIRHCTYEPAY